MNLMKHMHKRATAMLLAAALVLSSFSGMSMTAYATEDGSAAEAVSEATKPIESIPVMGTGDGGDAGSVDSTNAEFDAENKVLTISQSKMENHDESEAALTEMLNLYEGSSLHSIVFEFEDASVKLSRDFMTKAVNLLDDSYDARTVVFSLGEAGGTTETKYTIPKPQKTYGDAGQAYFEFTSASINTEDEVTISANSGSLSGNSLSFETTVKESYDEYVASELSSDYPAGTVGEVSVVGNESWENAYKGTYKASQTKDGYEVTFSFNSKDDKYNRIFTDGKPHEMIPGVNTYKGSSTYDDNDAGVSLVLSEKEMDRKNTDGYSVDNMVKALNAWKAEGMKFTMVTIEALGHWDDTGNKDIYTVESEIFNAAADILAEENSGIQYRFYDEYNVWNADSEESVYVYELLENYTFGQNTGVKKLDKNLILDTVVSVAEAPKAEGGVDYTANVTFTKNAADDFKQMDVTMSVYYASDENGTPGYEAEQLLKALGTPTADTNWGLEYALEPTEEDYVAVLWDNPGDNYYLYFSNIQNLVPGKEYTIVKPAEDNSSRIEGDTLVLETETQFTEAQIKAIAQRHSLNRFESIRIIQPKDEEHVIRANDVNVLRPLLSKNGRLIYEYKIKETKVDSAGGDVYSTYRYTMTNPGAMSADLDVTPIITAETNKGLTVKLASNAHKAEKAEITYTVPYGAVLAADIYDGIGWYMITDYSQSMYAFDSRNNLTDVKGWIYGSGIAIEWDEANETDILRFTDVTLEADVTAMKSASEYQMTVPEPVTLTRDGALTVAYPNENPYFKSFDTSILTISLEDYGSADYKVGNVKLINNGQTVVLEKTDKRFRAYDVTVAMEVTSVALAEKKIELDTYGNSYKNIKVNFYPGKAVVDDSKIRVVVEGGNENGNYIEAYYDSSNQTISISALEPSITAGKADSATITLIYGELDEDENIPEGTPTATMEVVIREPLVPYGSPYSVVAVTNFDAKLGDVPLVVPEALGRATENGTWEWANPETSLKNYAGMDYATFTAVFTEKDLTIPAAEEGKEPTVIKGRKLYQTVYVEFITITGVDIAYDYATNEGETPVPCAAAPEVMEKDVKHSVTMTAKLKYSQDDFSDADLVTYLTNEGMTLEAAAKFFTYTWTNPLKADENKDVNAKADAANPNVMNFIAGSEVKPGTKTFTLKVTYPSGTKTVTLANVSASFKVVNGDIIDFAKDLTIEYFAYGEDGKPAETGKSGLTGAVLKEKGIVRYTFKEGAKVYDLTAVSTDTKVIKLSKAKAVNTEKTVWEAEYEVKGYGFTNLSVTAKDENNSTKTETVDIVDINPIIETTSLTFNNQNTYDGDNNKTAEIYEQNGYKVIRAELAENSSLKEVLEVSLATKPSNNDPSDPGKPIILFRANDLSTDDGKQIPKGKHKETITLTLQKDNGEPVTVTKEFTINVIDTIPKATIKQSGKVNLFYKDMGDASAVLYGSIKNASIYDFVITDADADYRLEEMYENYTYAYYIKVKSGVDINHTEKKVNLSYKIRDDYGVYNKTGTFTIKTENKKPKITVNPKTLTLYPNQGSYGYSDGVRFSSSVYGDEIQTVKVRTDKNFTAADKALVLNAERSSVNFKNSNKYSVGWTNMNNGYSVGYNYLSFNVNTNNAKKATNKFFLQVNNSNWAEPITLNYSVKVDTKKPSLALSEKKIILNKNEALYKYQAVSTYVIIKDLKNSAGISNVRLSAVKAGDEDFMNKYLDIETNGSEITVRLNATKADILENKVAKGNHNFTVTGEVNGEKLSTALTVSIVDAAPEKAVKLSKKGSIDVLYPYSTSLSYDVKFSNLDAVIDYDYDYEDDYDNDGNYWYEDTGCVRLEGDDADMFEAAFEYGKLVIRARNGWQYSTKVTYKVTPVITVMNDRGETYEVTAAEQKIKVTQSKPKITLNNGVKSVTLYKGVKDTAVIPIEAFNKKIGTYGGEYTGIESVKLLNFKDDFTFAYDNSREEITLTLNKDLKEVTKTGKTYTLKFEVEYFGQASNMKNTTVTYKVVVK